MQTKTNPRKTPPALCLGCCWTSSGSSSGCSEGLWAVAGTALCWTRWFPAGSNSSTTGHSWAPPAEVREPLRKCVREREMPHKQCEEWRWEKLSWEHQGHRRERKGVPGTRADFPAAHGGPWGPLGGIDSYLLFKETLAQEWPSKEQGWGTRACGGVPCRSREKCEERAVKMKYYGLTTTPGLLRVRRQRTVKNWSWDWKEVRTGKGDFNFVLIYHHVTQLAIH